MREFALIEGFSPEIEFAEPVWLEALPARIYQTPMYGEVPVTQEALQRMVRNFKENVRGQEIATNFDHGVDVAKGNKASGWFRDFDIRPSADGKGESLYAKVEFTEEARKEIEEGGWKYFSLEWDDWMDNSGNLHKDVIVGGAITNRPVAKHMQTLPVNFSESLWNELDKETKDKFTAWSEEVVNSLPDSSFLYIESGGTLDADGKTEPRTNRHFPYRGNDGKVSLQQLHFAETQIAQDTKLDKELKYRLRIKARTEIKLSETAERDIADVVLEVLDESKEWEHSEPGTGSPPTPRTDEDGSDDPSISERWRRSPLPLDPNDPNAPKSDGGNVMDLDELLKQLRERMELPEATTPEQLLEVAGKSFSEAKSLRDAMSLVDEEKKFAETYPTMFAEHQKLKKQASENNAKNFSESVSIVKRPEGDKFVSSGQGLSTLAKEKIEALHIKFSEGTATQTDFEDVLTTVVNGGLVKFGEEGSAVPIVDEKLVINTDTADGIQNARNRFAELVNTVKSENAELSLSDAIREASKRDPELARAYRATAAA